MSPEEIDRVGSARVILMDSIALVTPDHRGAIVLTGSHGGQSAGDYALKVPLRGVIFNDAGIGKDEAGVVALTMLQARGIPAAAIAHTSGRIGDAKDMWSHGLISRLNEAAAACGVRRGMKAQEAIGQIAGSQ